MTTNSTDSITRPPLMSLPRSLLDCALLLLKRLSHTTMSTAMCKGLRIEHRPDMGHLHERMESYADVHPVTGEAREMTDPPFVTYRETNCATGESTSWVGDPPFVCYHLDTCDIGQCAPGCPCTHAKIGKEERSPWARPIEKEKVMETNEDNSPQSVAWSEVSRALECLSIDTARAIRVEMDQQYVFVTEFARDANGRFLSDDDVTLVTKTTRYEIDLTR